VRVGELIFVAGQGGLDPATGQVVGSTFDLQARRAFDNLRAILEDAGSGLDQVVKTTCFLAAPEAFDALNALYTEYFPTAPPARSTPVVQLPRGLLFSIEAVALSSSRAADSRRGSCTPTSVERGGRPARRGS
jgi:2-iminobutanoate/2-iminopropanoate deaminase